MGMRACVEIMDGIYETVAYERFGGDKYNVEGWHDLVKVAGFWSGTNMWQPLESDDVQKGSTSEGNVRRGSGPNDGR